MAYKIKGDLEVARLVSTTGIDTIPLVQTAVTLSAFAIDMSMGRRDFSLLMDNTSTGDISVNLPNNVPANGNKIRVNLANLDTVDRTYIFNPSYLRPDGSAVGSLIVTAGEGRVLEVYYTDSAPATWVVIADTNFATSAASGDRIFETITQAGHGFTVLQPVYHNGTNWQLSQADTPTTVAQTIITQVVDANTFVITYSGVATVTGHGLTVGHYYWLDQGAAGLLTLTQPVTGIVQPLVHVRDANTLFIDIEQAVESAIPVVSPSLHYVSINGSNPTAYAPRTGSFMDLDSPATTEISDPFGLINLDVAGDSVKVQQDGRYLILFSAACLTASNIQININGGSNIAAVRSSSADSPAFASVTVDLVTGNDIYIVSTNTLRNISYTVTQIAKNG